MSQLSTWNSEKALTTQQPLLSIILNMIETHSSHMQGLHNCIMLAFSFQNYATTQHKRIAHTFNKDNHTQKFKKPLNILGTHRMQVLQENTTSPTILKGSIIVAGAILKVSVAIGRSLPASEGLCWLPEDLLLAGKLPLPLISLIPLDQWFVLWIRYLLGKQ